MDNIIAVGLTFVLGIGVVGAFIAKYLSKAQKAVSLAKEALDVVDGVFKAVEDKNVTEDEVKKLIAEAKEAKAAFDALIAK